MIVQTSKSDNDCVYAKKIDIILILLDNNSIENIVKKRSHTENNMLRAETIKDKIHETLRESEQAQTQTCKNEYLVKYILNFSMNADIEELKYLIENNNSSNSSNNNNIFNLDTLKDMSEIRDIDVSSIDNLNNKFTDTDAIIIVLSKKEKIYYVKKKRAKAKNRMTKKNKKY